MSWSWSDIIVASGFVVVVAALGLAAFATEAMREENRWHEQREKCGRKDEPYESPEPCPLPKPCELPKPVQHEPEALETIV